jgi:hypothetical protein
VALADGPAATTGLLDQLFPNGLFANGSEHQFDFDALLALLAPKAPEIDLDAFPFSLLAHLLHGGTDAGAEPPDNMPGPAPEAQPDPLHHLAHSGDGLWT